MAAKKSAGAGAGSMSITDDPAGVDRLIETLPAAALVRRVRAAVLDADAGITQGVKWNSPSFALGVWFATINARAKSGVTLVLHLGAAPRAGFDAAPKVRDPGGLLTWRGADRATIEIADAASFRRDRAGVTAVVRSWIEMVRSLGAG